jgi:hypothetical protein
MKPASKHIAAQSNSTLGAIASRFRLIRCGELAFSTLVTFRATHLLCDRSYRCLPP